MTREASYHAGDRGASDAAPLISVVMPAYNAMPYLPEAVASILNQTLTDFEFIIINDGSSDGTQAYLESLDDPRLRVLNRRRNRGLTRALRLGVRLARGRFIARMDSDDIALPARFAYQADYLQGMPEVLAVGSDLLLVDDEGLPLGVEHKARKSEAVREQLLVGRTALAHPSVMMRTSAIRKVGSYRAACEPAEDLDLWLRLSETGELRNLPEVLLKYRVHPRSVSQTRREEQRRMVDQVVAEARQRQGLPRHEVAVLESIDLPRLYRQWSKQALAHGYWATAAKYARLAQAQPVHSESLRRRFELWWTSLSPWSARLRGITLHRRYQNRPQSSAA